MIWTTNSTLRWILIELLSLTPLLIMLGNVVPPFPIKMHFIGFGIEFLIATYLLIVSSDKKWLVYTFLFYFSLQILFDQIHLKELIDFFFGPFILMLMLDIVVNKKLPIAIILKAERRFFWLMWLPISIAILQYFQVLPLTFWNATYINSSIIDGVYFPRPNGFLYHGAELSVIICLAAIHQFFMKEQQAFWLLLVLVIASFLTYFKAVFGGLVLLFAYYLTVVNRGVLRQFQFLDIRRIMAYGTIVLVAVVVFAIGYFKQVYHYTGYFFVPRMLTGRGSIWNVYSDAISDYSIWNYLLGSGIGSPFDLFKEYASPKNWWPLTVSDNLKNVYDPHNAVLSVFLNTGILGFVFIGFMYKVIYNRVINLRPSAKWNKIVFWGILIIPLFTIGITIPIYEMAIFWVGLAFVCIRWLSNNTLESEHKLES